MKIHVLVKYGGDTYKNIGVVGYSLRCTDTSRRTIKIEGGYQTVKRIFVRERESFVDYLLSYALISYNRRTDTTDGILRL